jgi:hypothetical protein
MKASPETNRARRPAEIPQRKQRNFEPLYHSVYDGRERLGHYIRIAPRRYAAYDAHNRLLGKFGSKARLSPLSAEKTPSEKEGVLIAEAPNERAPDGL